MYYNIKHSKHKLYLLKYQKISKKNFIFKNIKHQKIKFEINTVQNVDQRNNKIQYKKWNFN